MPTPSLPVAWNKIHVRSSPVAERREEPVLPAQGYARSPHPSFARPWNQAHLTSSTTTPRGGANKRLSESRSDSPNSVPDDWEVAAEEELANLSPKDSNESTPALVAVEELANLSLEESNQSIPAPLVAAKGPEASTDPKQTASPPSPGWQTATRTPRPSRGTSAQRGSHLPPRCVSGNARPRPDMSHPGWTQLDGEIAKPQKEPWSRPCELEVVCDLGEYATHTSTDEAGRAWAREALVMIGNEHSMHASRLRAYQHDWMWKNGKKDPDAEHITATYVRKDPDGMHKHSWTCHIYTDKKVDGHGKTTYSVKSLRWDKGHTFRKNRDERGTEVTGRGDDDESRERSRRRRANRDSGGQRLPEWYKG